MFFSDFKVKKIEEKGNKFYLEGEALGEKIDLNRHELKTEVKAATYHGLKVEKTDDECRVRCVVDV